MQPLLRHLMELPLQARLEIIEQAITQGATGDERKRVTIAEIISRTRNKLQRRAR